MHGTFETIDDRPAVRFERRLAHPIDTVWRAVTEPAELAHWFPGRVEIDGSRLRFEDAGTSFDGEVRVLEPPRRFEFTWGPTDELRIELEEAGDGCLMRLTHLLGSRDQAARDAAGWHVCLDRLAASLDGEDTTAPGSDPTAEWRGHYEEYERLGLPTGAHVPS
jgi:uncharacterized protein YndB with AHSA1/START domain